MGTHRQTAAGADFFDRFREYLGPSPADVNRSPLRRERLADFLAQPAATPGDQNRFSR
jgi:hypothetical protein